MDPNIERIFDRESISHGPKSLKIVVVLLLLIGVLKTAVRK